ncbi:Pvc16 family protein [Flavobacterium sp. W22_SRS_FK3]|uniref:Pvc16 family protein n=1 Tax=Flavobacterium sp. W22_SRS_FK3 TaxID=3240275 RepID=UPI003F928976
MLVAVFPEIRIELLVLFVAKFNDYTQSLKFLSYVIKFFQANRVFDPRNSPELYGENIEKLIVELVTLPLEEQNQVWHS